MATAQNIIEAGYARSTANDPGKLATDTELVEFLNRIFQTFYAMAALAKPAAFLSRVSMTLAASVGSLPTDVIDIRWIETNAGAPVNLIPVAEKGRSWHLAPRVYRRGNSIVSVGGVGDPGATDTLILFVLDAPATLTSLATTLDARFPVRHLELLSVDVALYLDAKDEGRNPAEHGKLKAYRDVLWQAFAESSGIPTSAHQSPHGRR